MASAKAPEGVDSSAAVETLLQQEQVKEDLAGMFTPEQLQEVVDVAKPKGVRESTMETMEQWAAENPVDAVWFTDDILAHHQVNNSHKELVGTAIGLAMAPGIVAAPLVAGASVALSVGANYAGKEIALACGADQTTAETVGFVSGLAAGGAIGLVRAPVATVVETALAVGAERGTEAAMLAAGYSHEAASDVGAIVGAWTPLMTGGRAGAVAERGVGATGRTLKTAGQHVVSEVSRIEVKVDRLTAGTVFGNVSVGVRPRATAVEVPTTRTTPASTQAAAEWTRPMSVAPKVEYTAPAASMRASVSHYEPVVRPTVPMHVDTVPSHPVRPMVTEPVMTHSAPSAGASKVKPTVEPVVEAGVSEAPLSLPKYESGRYVPGKAIMSFELTNPPVLLRGSHNNVAKVPLEVAQKMSGKEFKTFDEFRSEFWKTMAESSYAREFKPADIARMFKGNAPIAHLDQSLGSRVSYELHHMTPIHKGGAVYDMSNILIVTPKYHKEILSKHTHYGVK